jgi:hypothetical protein
VATQILLFQGYGYSGRAAKIRTLSPTENDRVSADAAKETGSGAVEYRIAQVRIGVCRMLVAVTKGEVPYIDKPVLDREGKPVLEKDGQTPKVARVPDDTWMDNPANWTPIDPLLIAVPGGYEKYIDNPKDDDLLGRIWSTLHEAGPSDVDRIMGKARRASTG